MTEQTAAPAMPEVKAPWLKSLGDIPAHLDYFQGRSEP